MAVTPHILVRQYRQRGGNVLLFHEGRFLLLPSGECEATKLGLLISRESLGAALDMTPDLPERIVSSAWNHRMVFANEVKPEWALSVASQIKGLSGHDVIQAFQHVTPERRTRRIK